MAKMPILDKSGPYIGKESGNMPTGANIHSKEDDLGLYDGIGGYEVTSGGDQDAATDNAEKGKFNVLENVGGNTTATGGNPGHGKPKLGSGKRFKQVEAAARKSGATNPAAVAASAGIKKWGQKKMTAMAKAGKRRKK